MTRILIFFCSLLFTSAWAQEGEWNKAFNVIWESRWQQSGYPLAAVRFPMESKTIKFSINKAASTSSNAQRAREAIDVVTKVLDWKAIEVEEGSTEAQIEIIIRRYTDEEMRSMPCVTFPAWRNGLYTKQRIHLSEQFAYRCALHELMHAFGFPGHPQGDTVLSYFEGNFSSLKPMDVFLLQAWYSDAVKPGESPFLTVNNLILLWVQKKVAVDQQPQALESQKRWYLSMLKSMNDFASGHGEPPTILYRSGRLNDDGIKRGRANIQGMLGAAYLNGWAVEKDSAKAAKLLLTAAQAGNDGAAGIIARRLLNDAWDAEQAKPLCQWLQATPAASSKIPSQDQQAALDSALCKKVLTP